MIENKPYSSNDIDTATVNGQDEEKELYDNNKLPSQDYTVSGSKDSKRQILFHNNPFTDKIEEIDFGSLHNNDNKVLSIFNQNNQSTYTFKGLMRTLNIHQQSLSRSLKRLEDLNIIEKSHEGYKLSLAARGQYFPARSDMQRNAPYTQLLQTFLPPSIDARSIVTGLIGKWFSNFRWMGLIESEVGWMLQWQSEDGSFQINLRIISDCVIIETNAHSDKEKIDAMAGSYRIFEFITKRLQMHSGQIGMIAFNSTPSYHLN